MRKPVMLPATLLLAQLAFPAHADDRAAVMLPMFSQELILMQPQGWHVGTQHQDAKKAVVEFVPADDTSADWQESLTVEAYKGLAGQTRYGADIILKVIATELAAHCSQPLINMPLEATTVGGYKASVTLLGCPEASADAQELETGQGEIGLYVSIKGRQDFYVIRHSLRGESFDASQPPINPQNFLGYVAKSSPLMLCEIGDTPQTCAHRSPDATP